MKLIRVRDSKFGPALVVETSQRCGGYILGFRMDPAEHLQAVFQEVQSLHTVYSATPVFGVDRRPARVEPALFRSLAPCPFAALLQPARARRLSCSPADTTEDKPLPLEEVKAKRTQDDVQIVDDDETDHDTSASAHTAYFPEGEKQTDREARRLT